MDRATVLDTIKRDLESKVEVENDDIDEETSTNLIVQNFSVTTDKRVEITSMFATIMAQRELDQQKIIALNKENADLEKDLSRIETQLHYLRLDLNNTSIQHLEAVKERDRVTKELITVRKELSEKETMRKFLNSTMFFFLFLFMSFTVYPRL
jgi:chromosome segregation ATPase